MTSSLPQARQKGADSRKGSEEFDLCLCWQQTYTNTSYAKCVSYQDQTEDTEGFQLLSGI